VGARYVRTDVETKGYVILPAPTFFQAAVIERSYDDLLPSLNLAAEIAPDVQLRFSAARVMSRPPLSLLNPGGTITTVSRGLTIGNPDLEPVRANTLDLAAEYYFGAGGLVSLGLFYKDIESTVQVIRRLVPFSETGLPPSILQGSQATPDDLFQVTRAVNAKGGPLEGLEINYQQPLTFLPGFLAKLGTLLNYVYVSSEVDYVVGANADQTVTTDLTGLSKHSANGTIYYDDGKFSIRASLNYRSGYLVTVPSGGPGSDVDGVRSSIFVDASSSYAVTDRLRLTLDAQNLTNEWATQYSDSRRQDPLYQTLTGRTYTMGASYRF
jgi:TonB-dependent receptor